MSVRNRSQKSKTGKKSELPYELTGVFLTRAAAAESVCRSLQNLGISLKRKTLSEMSGYIVERLGWRLNFD